MKNLMFICLVMLSLKVSSQTCQMTFTNPTYNSATNKYRATLTISSTSGNNTWELGNMNLRFNYPISTLSNPVIASNLLPGTGFSYGAPTTVGSNTSTGVMSYNIILPSGLAGKAIPTSGFNIMTVEWDVISISGLSNAANKLQWRNPSTFANPRLAIVTSTQTSGCPAGCTLAYTSTPDLAPLLPAGNPLTVTITKTDQTSCSSPDGSATATPTTGISPYTYLWSNGATTSTISGLSAGSFSVTVTDNTASSGTANTTIAAPPAVNGTATSITQPTCNGGANGSVVITASGGVSPYTITPAQTGLAAGSYTFTITDSKGCKATVPVTVNQPAAMTATVTGKTDASCGLAVGTVAISVSGGTSPYTIVPAQTGLAAGNYTFTVTDSQSCTTTVSTTINNTSGLTVSSSAQSVSCFGGTNGSVTVNASGGTPPYTIVPAQTGLAAGNYTFTVTDASGCSSTTSATITQPAQLLATVISQTNVTCAGGMNGSVTISATGGTAPYTILPLQNSLSAGNYTFTITDSKGCSVTKAVTILDGFINTVNAGPDITINCSNPSATLTATGGSGTFLWSTGATTASITVSPATTTTYAVTISSANGCTATDAVVVTSFGTTPPTANAGPDVTITYGSNTTLTASGGVSYLWSNGASTASIIVSPVNRTTYTVTVTESNGCTATDDVIVVVEKKYNLTFVNPAIIGNKFRFTVRMSTSTPFCIGSNNLRFNFNKNALNNLTIVSDGFPHPAFSALTTTGTNYTSGIASINAAYNDVASACLLPITASGTDLVTCEFTIINPVQTTQFIWRNSTTPQLAVVADDKFTACIANVLIGLDLPLLPLTINGINKQDALCFGSATGSAAVDASGGLPPYSYIWNNGASTQSISGLGAGTYAVTVSDASGTTVSSQSTIGSPAALTVTSTQNNVSCAGLSNGSVNISVTGGIAPYSISPATTGLASGTYEFTITDANNCTKTISATITQPTPLTATFTQTNVSCNGGSDGSVLITPSGGTPGYSIIPAQTGLSAGSYTFTISDVNGCTSTISTTISQPAPLSLSATQPAPICSNTTTDITLSSNGTTPFTYGYCSGLNCTNFGSSQTSPVFNLGVGNYTFKVTDAKGCATTTTVTINSLTPPSANAGLDVTIAYGASTNLTATGGVSYLWSNGATTATITVAPVNRTTYSVTVTGTNGCTAKDDVAVIVEKKYSLSFVNSTIIGNKLRFTIRMSTSTPFCIGNNNLRFNFNKNALNNLTIVSDNYPHPAFGTLTTTGTSYTSGIATINTAYNGTASACLVPITAVGTDLVTCEFTITNPALTSQFIWRNTTTPLLAVVADDKLTACIPDVLMGLDAPLTPLTITGITKQDIPCFGLATGAASVSANGGLLPYTYQWSNGATTQSISNLVAGTYTVTVNDAYGYSLNASATVNSPAALSVSLTQVNVSCAGRNDGSVNIAIAGGTAPFMISPTTTQLAAGAYTFTITDANGCSTTESATIIEPALMTASPDVTVNCFSPGATIAVTGGTSFIWSTGATTSGITVSPMVTTAYQVTATSGTCVEIKTIVVTADKVVVGATAGPDLTINCINPTVHLNAMGGASYLWSNGATTQSQNVNPSVTTSYSVTITGTNGCVATDNAMVFYDIVFPIADAGYDTYVDCNKTVALLKARNTLNNDPQVIDSYIWSNGSSSADVPVSPSVNTTYSVTITGPNGCSATDNVQVQVQPCNAVVNAKVYLGNFDLGTMSMDNYLSTLPDFPLTDPYSSPAFNGNFTHVNNNLLAAISPDLFQITGNNAVMDWIFLELRKDISGFAVPVCTRSAILQRDGDIVSTDGVTPVNFPGVPSGSYYIVVKHRNHLAFRTLNPISLSAATTSLNFTNNTIPMLGSEALYNLTPSILTMCGGDANSDGSVDAFDTIIWETQNGLFDDYNYGADYNMDGSVDAFDSIIWGTHNGKFQEVE